MNMRQLLAKAKLSDAETSKIRSLIDESVKLHDARRSRQVASENQRSAGPAKEKIAI
jgi:hypothetical protein